MNTLTTTTGDTVPIAIDMGADMTDHTVAILINTVPETEVPVTFTDRLTGAGQFSLPVLAAGIYQASVSITYPDSSHICSRKFRLAVEGEA